MQLRRAGSPLLRAYAAGLGSSRHPGGPAEAEEHHTRLGGGLLQEDPADRVPRGRADSLERSAHGRLRRLPPSPRHAFEARLGAGGRGGELQFGSGLRNEVRQEGAEERRDPPVAATNSLAVARRLGPAGGHEVSEAEAGRLEDVLLHGLHAGLADLQGPRRRERRRVRSTRPIRNAGPNKHSRPALHSRGRERPSEQHGNGQWGESSEYRFGPPNPQRVRERNRYDTTEVFCFVFV